MPLYDVVCDECGFARVLIIPSFELQQYDDHPEPCPEEGCDGTLTRQFPTANFNVRGGTPRHHG